MRLFVAVDLPSTVKDELDRTIGGMRASMLDAKWVPRDNIHLTLSFLGEVPEERVEPVIAALHHAVAPIEPFPARLAGSGAFPSPRRARVLWAGLESEGDQLLRLAGSVAENLEPLGFAREERRWTAHVTIARLRVPENVAALFPIRIKELPVPVDEVTLFRSRLARPAPRYEPVTRVPLGG